MGTEWVRKYRPKSAAEVQGQDKAVRQLKGYIENYKGKKPAMLYGPPGTGKTAAAYAVAGDLDLEVVEVNASDVRNKGRINEIVGGALGQQSLLAKGKIILVDEIDGLSGHQDRGGVQAITKLMENASFPVVLTANDPYSQKFSKLRRKCQLVEFGNLSYTSINANLRDIAKAEGIKYKEDVMKQLARMAGGDMRAAINDLQTLASDGNLTKEDLEVLGGRARKDSIFDALVRVFKTTDAGVARSAYREVDEDLDDIFLWVENNIHVEYKKPEDLARAFDNLSTADVFYGRIRKWQHYRFYVYCYDLLSAGIALSKDEKYKGFTKYKRSTKPLKIWRSNQQLAKKKSIAAKVAEGTHTSVTEAMQSTIPFFKLPVRKDRKFAKQFTEFFELDEAEAAWMAK